MGRKSDKEKFLDDARALNSEPETVTDPKFQAPEGFFDARDKVQVKYEMLRAHEVDRETVQEAARRFGFSRESFYKDQERFRSEGVLGLVERKRGRRGPQKLTEEIVCFLDQSRRRDPTLSGARLAEMVAECHGVQLHKRTVEKAMGATVGRSKKNKTLQRKQRRRGRRKKGS